MYQTFQYKAPPITDKWAGLLWAELINGPGIMHSRFGIPATWGVYVCCWLLAERATLTKTVVAQSVLLACLTQATRDVGTSASPGHAIEGRTHAASALEMHIKISHCTTR